MSSIKVIVDPFVALSILDHHQRRPADDDQVHGLLFGSKGKGIIKITNFVPSMTDAESQAQLVQLTLRCCPGDSLRGLYATDPTLSSEIDRAALLDLFLAVHLPTEDSPTISFKAFQVDRLTIGGVSDLRSFREAPCEVAATSATGSVAVDAITRKLCPEVANSTDPATVPSITSDSKKQAGDPAAFAEFQQLRRNLKQASEYCKKASEGKINGDANLGRRLSSTLLSDLNVLSLSPNLDKDIEIAAQDSLMLSYIMKLLAQKVAELRMNYHETLEELVGVSSAEEEAAAAAGANAGEGSSQQQQQQQP